MHAVVVHATINDAEASLDRLRNDTVPQVKNAPGAVAGYWTRKDDTGISIAIFGSEDDANAMSERVPTVAPAGVTVEKVEVREVVAHF